MLLPFNDELVVTSKADIESQYLADRHYSRQTPGAPIFMPPGKTLVIRNTEGTLVFGWLWQNFRDDGEAGFNCSIFRNESSRVSSEVILQCEKMAFETWGPNRVFTYVSPSKIRSQNPGCCFKKAGWKFVRKSKSGLHLLAKEYVA